MMSLIFFLVAGPISQICLYSHESASQILLLFIVGYQPSCHGNAYFWSTTLLVQWINSLSSILSTARPNFMASKKLVLTSREFCAYFNRLSSFFLLMHVRNPWYWSFFAYTARVEIQRTAIASLEFGCKHSHEIGPYLQPVHMFPVNANKNLSCLQH